MCCLQPRCISEHPELNSERHQKTYLPIANLVGRPTSRSMPCRRGSSAPNSYTCTESDICVVHLVLFSWPWTQTTFHTPCNLLYRMSICLGNQSRNIFEDYELVFATEVRQSQVSKLVNFECSTCFCPKQHSDISEVLS
jgi:hypothetical protein